MVLAPQTQNKISATIMNLIRKNISALSAMMMKVQTRAYRMLKALIMMMNKRLALSVPSHHIASKIMMIHDWIDCL